MRALLAIVIAGCLCAPVSAAEAPWINATRKQLRQDIQDAKLCAEWVAAIEGTGGRSESWHKCMRTLGHE